jgi:hypothetical protein
MRSLAQAGDVEGLKAVEIPKPAKKLATYREQLLNTLKAGPPEPESKPKASSTDDPAMETEIKALEKGLIDEFGFKIRDDAKGNRIRSKGWLKILKSVRPEVEKLEARWPGITKGTTLRRQMPGAGALGVYDTEAGFIRLVPYDYEGGSIGTTNKFGQKFSIGNGDLGTVFRHEFGHSVDYRTKAKYRDAIKQTHFTDENGKDINAAKWGKRHISDYAGTMTSEMIAEAWAFYTSEGYDGEMGERLDAIMEAMATGGEPPPPELAEIPGGHIL